jgi:uncharacterized protein
VLGVLLTATALGLVMGAIVGGLGGGGGVLTVPALVYVLGQSAHDATTGSVIIVGVTALAGVLARGRTGIDLRMSLAFGAVGIPSAWLGSLLNGHVDQPVLLLSFAGLTVVAAAAMLLDSRRGSPEPALVDPPAGGGVTMAPGVRTLERAGLVEAVKILVCGAAVGFLTGFLGVGGGFLVVPALVVVLGIPMRSAVGTSLLIIVINTVASLASRVGDMHLDWHVIAPFTLAAVAATFAGKRVADRLSGPVLTRSFAVMLLAVGLFVAVENVLAP